MATIFVFNNSDGGLERYNRTPSEPMPHTVGDSLLVSDFLGSNELGWTDTATMQAWNSFYSAYARPLNIDRAFACVEEVTPGLLTTPQHLAGTAFAAGSDLTPSAREELVRTLLRCGAFSFVRPYAVGDAAVCFDNRYMASGTFATHGFPVLYRGSCNHYVLTLQSLLNAAGLTRCAVDGIFGAQTARALRDYQYSRRLPENGIAGREEWASLLSPFEMADRSKT